MKRECVVFGSKKQAADSCVSMTNGWESQLWSADLQHQQERSCTSDVPGINPLRIFPITGRIIGKAHPHIPAPLGSDEPYKAWLWPPAPKTASGLVRYRNPACNVLKSFPYSVIRFWIHHREGIKQTRCSDSHFWWADSANECNTLLYLFILLIVCWWASTFSLLCEEFVSGQDPTKRETVYM